MISFTRGFTIWKGHWPGGEEPWVLVLVLLLTFLICSIRSLDMVTFTFLASLKYLVLYVNIYHSSNNVQVRKKKKKKGEKGGRISKLGKEISGTNRSIYNVLNILSQETGK